MFIKETYVEKTKCENKEMFTTSIFKLMASIPSILSKLFGAGKKEEKQVLTQATKLEAAYNSIKELKLSGKYSMQYSKADSFELTTMSKTLPEFVDYLEGYLLLLKSKQAIRISDIRGAPEKVTLTGFLTSDNYYVPLSVVSDFHKVAEEILDILIVHKDKETGNESYYIRILGNTLVSIKNIADAFTACKKPSK